MMPLYREPQHTFRFADDRLIARFHLEGVPAGCQVSVFAIDSGTGQRRGLLATAVVGEGGWVNLPVSIVVRSGEAFIVVPESEGRATTTEPFQIAAESACSADAAALIAELSAELAHRYDYADDGSGDFRPEDATVPGSVFLIGRLAGRPVACGAVRPFEGRVGEVKRVYVRPDVRGQGLSRRLLAALEDAARQMGYLALRLETGARQPESIRLYESAGYQRGEPFGIYIGDPHSVYFEKRLT